MAGSSTGAETRSASLAAVIIAVLAALGTLYAHHRSIAALSAKNGAILAQAKASDAYAASEAQDIRAMLDRALGSRAAARNDARLYPAALARARGFETESAREDMRSESILRSYEKLQVATTLFEISIVLVSLSTLTASRFFLPLGCTVSAIGLVIFAIGLLGRG